MNPGGVYTPERPAAPAGEAYPDTAPGVRAVVTAYLEASSRLQRDLQAVEGAHPNLFYLRCLLESGDRAVLELMERGGAV